MKLVELRSHKACQVKNLKDRYNNGLLPMRQFCWHGGKMKLNPDLLLI